MHAVREASGQGGHPFPGISCHLKCLREGRGRLRREDQLGEYLDRAIKDGHAFLQEAAGKTRITYVAIKHDEIFDDPEEKVRAEFWAELIYRYSYEPQRIGIEITVPDRTPKDSADLVVFRDDERKDPFAVIETKKDGISDSEFGQAVEQAAGNGTADKFRAEYIGVVAGLTRRFLDFTDAYGAMEREKNVIADLPAAYGKPQEFKFTKGGTLDISAVSREELITAIAKCHQTLWQGGKLSPPQAFSELCKLIFVKIADEKAKRKTGEPYQFQIKTHETAKALAGRIRKLYDKQKVRDPDVFTETIKVSDGQVRAIVTHLQEINLSATDLDVKGLAFEQFMDGFFKGDFGQYFTPRDIIRFTVSLVTPTNEDRVLDPACGSGGFLLYALDAVRAEADEFYAKNSREHYAHWHDFALKQLHGIEVNEEICRVSKMNMLLHDDGHTNVVCEDAAQPISILTMSNRQLTAGNFDIILTNPPFGATIERSDAPWLKDYELGKKMPKGKRQSREPRESQKTEIVFIERVWELLKPGTGRVGIVLPDGVLYNKTLAYVRDFMRERFQISAIVSLPASAFAHYGTTVKASVVVMRRRADGEDVDENEPTFMAAPEKIGYDATGRKTASELPEIAASYQRFLDDPIPFLPEEAVEE
jgi:type I restriction enzyme M protein